METTDNSGKKLWRPSWKGVIITLLVGSNIILIRIIEGLVSKGQSLEKRMNQIAQSSDQLRVEIKKQLCVNTRGKLGCVVCPDGWLRHGENCFNISSGGEYRTWNESREVCEGKGAHLLVIEDPEQQSFGIDRSSDFYPMCVSDVCGWMVTDDVLFSQKFINGSINQQTDGKFWIGLYRDGDGWRWVDGRLYNTSL
ncbi:killer cell lectin-like receptor subfamily G member 1 [Aquarana catesbeiana]|uniref:killer cell lectin-like receptor subfamily G member 1 n=1 Tax=Aquarana catesbeiana TaxID=8400 RepID=UPI003CC9795B